MNARETLAIAFFDLEGAIERSAGRAFVELKLTEFSARRSTVLGLKLLAGGREALRPDRSIPLAEASEFVRRCDEYKALVGAEDTKGF
jgi:hypothetical protein